MQKNAKVRLVSLACNAHEPLSLKIDTWTMLGYFEQVHERFHIVNIRYSLYEINIEEVSAGFGMQTENPYYCNTKYGVYAL